MEAFEEYCVELLAETGKPRREGPAVTYYDDGGVWVESRYHEGKLEGEYVEHHRGGRVARRGAYEAGLRVGTWRVFAEDGTLLEESRWVKGERHGAFTAYWPGGKPRTEGRHCHGAQCGAWRSYDEAGRLQGTVEYGELRDVP
jgi:antitoxin component YwqK of YwqJK toxin-antitoxin module